MVVKSITILICICLLGIIGLHSSYAQNNDEICNELQIDLSNGRIITAIQKHTLFTSLSQLNVRAENQELASVCNLARVNLYLKNRNYEACDSLLTFCKSSMLFANDYYKAYCFRYVGLSSYYQNQNQSALENFLKGYDLFIQQNDTVNALKLLKNCGIIYMDTHNFKKAEEIFNKALLIAHERKIVNQEKYCLLNLGGVYLQLNEYDKAVNLHLQLYNNYKLELKEKAMVFQNLGISYFLQNEYELAKSYLDSSLVFNQKLGDIERVVKVKVSLSKIALHNEELVEGEKLLRECLAFYKDSGNWNEKIAIYYNFIDLYSSINNRDSLLRYIKLYADAKNAVRDSENQHALLELSAKYEIAQKDQEIALLNNQNKLRSFEVSQQKIMVGIISGVAIFAIIAGLVINGHRRRLYNARNELRLSNEAKDRIISIIGHDLRGPIGGLKSLMEIYMELPVLDANDIDKLLHSALESSTNTYLLLENLLTWANSQRGQIVFNPQSVAVYPVVMQVVNLLECSGFEKNIRFIVDIDKTLIISIDVDMFMGVLRNLLSNSIKFSPDKSAITVSVQPQKSGVLFCIHDEGIGMTEQDIYRLFIKKEAYYLENTKNAKGSGLGLILCKEFVEYHGGVIWAKSIEGEGSWFYFTIPDRMTKVDIKKNEQF